MPQNPSPLTKAQIVVSSGGMPRVGVVCWVYDHNPRTIGESPKLGVPYLGGPYNMDPTI